MEVLFCGVRGSTPAPGPEFVRYGGNTSCVAIGRAGEDPVLVLDGGTGLARLTRHVEGRPFRGTILLGHLHWDHTHGLPFFASGDNPGARVHVVVPGQGDAVEVLARAMSPPHFPVRPDELRGEWTFASMEPGDHVFESFEVMVREIPHKGGRTMGFRVSDGSSAVAYLSDHSPQSLGAGPHGYGPYHGAALELARDVDLLIHDSQYTTDEFAGRADFGHSSIDYTIGLAREAGARRLALFHHDPRRTDDQLDGIMAGLNGSVPAGLDVFAAAEDIVITV
jgi:phosphoribosyl 1,2-cyclic phosphodiesterase